MLLSKFKQKILIIDDELQKLTSRQRNNFTPRIVDLFYRNKITFNQIKNLTQRELENFTENTALFLIHDKMTAEQVINLTFLQRENLNHNVIKNLLLSGEVKFNQIKDITIQLIEIMSCGKATFAQVNNLKTEEEKENFHITKFVKLLISGHARFDQIRCLERKEKNNFTDIIINLIYNNKATFEQIRILTEIQKDNFNHSNVIQLIINNKITFEQINNLEDLQCYKFSNSIYKIMMADKAIFEDIISLDERDVNFLHKKELLIINDKARLEQIKSLTTIQKDNFNSFTTSLITNNNITFELVRDLTRGEYNTLINIHINTDTLNITTREELNILLDQIRVQHGQGIRVGGELLNSNQSTHTESVTKTVSESAVKLQERYKIQDSEMNKIFQEMEKFIKELPKASNWDNNLKNYNQLYINDKKLDSQEFQIVEANKQAAARRAFYRLKKSDHMDIISNVSTKKLLCLAWKVVNETDQKIAHGVINDRKAAFIDGLYQTQREYIISNNNGKDNQSQEDVYSHACAGGTFNKIMESICTLHTDINIEFITGEVLTCKLGGDLLIDETIKYLSNHPDKEVLFKEIKVGEPLADEILNDDLKKNILKELDDFKELFPHNPEKELMNRINNSLPYKSISKKDYERMAKELDITISKLDNNTNTLPRSNSFRNKLIMGHNIRERRNSL